MNLNPLKMVMKFNKEANLLDKGYNDELECSFPIEEALESFENTDALAAKLGLPNGSSPKDISRAIISNCVVGNPSNVSRLDKHLDIIVFSLGSIYKLGLNPQAAIKALGIVMKANMEKLKGIELDEYGKLLKKETFVNPEPELQKMLDDIGNS